MKTVIVSPTQNVVTVHPSESVIEVVQTNVEVEVISPGIQGPAPTGTSLGDLAEISSLANDDKLLIFDESENLTRAVRLDVLKVYFNS
jgi:hypothetical protein